MGDYVFGKVSVAAVTPFVDPEVDPLQPVDCDSLRNVIQHIAAGLADQRSKFGLIGGIIVSGTTGEQHTMTVEERCELFALAVPIAERCGIPVAAGIAATTIASVQCLVHAALSAGCKGIMLGLPPYCRLCDEEIREYVMAVKTEVPDGFPILLYNNVMRNGYGPSMDLIAELCRSNVIWGVKHAVLPDQFHSQALRLLELEPTVRLYTGSDKMAVELLTPVAENSSTIPVPRFYGLTSIVGNIYPAEIATIVSMLTANAPSTATTDSNKDREKEHQKAHELHQGLCPVLDAVLLGCSLPVGIKYALRRKQLGGGHTRLPVGFVSEAKMREIDAALEGYDRAGK